MPQLTGARTASVSPSDRNTAPALPMNRGVAKPAGN